MRPSRRTPLLRGFVGATIATFVALASHVWAGGDMPGMLGVAVPGLMIAVFLMIGGISLVGSITATLASWIVQRVSDEDEEGRAVTTAHVDALLNEIGELREEVRRLRHETSEINRQTAASAR